MAVRPILQIGDPALRRVAAPVEDVREIEDLVTDLIDTMRHAKGAGLAATQIGVDRRVCVIEVGDNPRYPYKPKIPLTVLINPELEALTDETFDNYEGCLSVPDLRGVVARRVGVRVKALMPDGSRIEREIWGLSAGTFQHEIDHLDGRLFVDRVTDSTTLCSWASFDTFHKASFVARVEALVARFGS